METSREDTTQQKKKKSTKKESISILIRQKIKWKFQSKTCVLCPQLKADKTTLQYYGSHVCSETQHTQRHYHGASAEKTKGEQSSLPSSHSSVYIPSYKASLCHNFPLFPLLSNSQEPVTTYELANIPFHPSLFRGLVKHMEELLSCWVFYCLDQNVLSCFFLNYEKTANAIQWLSPP